MWSNLTDQGAAAAAAAAPASGPAPATGSTEDAAAAALAAAPVPAPAAASEPAAAAAASEPAASAANAEAKEEAKAEEAAAAAGAPTAEAEASPAPTATSSTATASAPTVATVAAVPPPAPAAAAPTTAPTPAAPTSAPSSPKPAATRTAEIWSTRLHREILALTGEGGGGGGDGSGGNTDKAHKHDADTVGVLPPFITLEDHTIDIDKGLCDVTFRIEVEPSTLVPGAAAAGEKKKEEKEEKDGEQKEEPKDEEEPGKSEEADGEDKKKDQDEEAKDEAPSEQPPPSEEEATAAEPSEEQPQPPLAAEPHVIIMLDASTGTTADGSGPAATPSSYPFQPPTAMLISGANLFPRPGSDISDGDYLDIDLDWTPSLHLNDAILNVALKVRESIRRGEPFYAKENEDDEDEDGKAQGETIRAEMAAEIAHAGKKVSSFFSTGLTTLKQNATHAAALAGEVVAPSNVAAAAGGGITAVAAAEKKKKAKKPSTGSDEVAIGDEIDLSESPWNVCAGMYSCRAIRRPAFVEEEMAKAEAETKVEQQQNAGAGKAGAFFSSFRNQAKSVLEETFLMIGDVYIIEIKTNKFSIGTGRVTFVTLISNLAKLKFRREESISLFLKQDPSDPLIYMMAESADCVKQIQTVLKAHGVKGKHTNAAMQRSIQTALSIVADIRKKEKELEADPTIENVNEIMDLCRQAAERFEQAGDPRHKEVMTHMKKFLSNPITVSILNGTYEPKAKPAAAATTPSKPVPEGEVLTSPEWMIQEDDDDDDKKKDGATAADDSVEKADTVLAEAKKDMEQLGVSGASALDDILNTSTDADLTGGVDGVDDDAMAELDAMFKDADAELADLMKE